MTTTPTSIRTGAKGTKTGSGRLAPVECWHECPAHAAMYPAWKSLSDADQMEIGVLWQHPVNAIAKIDEYERLCPQCREEQRVKNHPVG
jgi:hypothetical protein